MYTWIIPAILAILTLAIITSFAVLLCLKSLRETKMRIKKENLVLRAKLAITCNHPEWQDNDTNLTGCGGMYSPLQILFGGNSDEEDN